MKKKLPILNYLEMNKRELDRWRIGDLAKYKLSPESKGAHIEQIIKSIEWNLLIIWTSGGETLSKNITLPPLNFHGLRHS
ncbi:hypothetical protein ACQKMD_00395 [Viridibacillus sp. NPDC096237]|uniref:hypothetical protein n=1 Tax=Viridibacillus sp. NPDC096237 TaxID=3390721 RepID=UPI003D05A261